MSQNHSLPSRDCAHFAPLLPLAAHDLLSKQEAARLDTHLATCAHCRGQITIDTRLEAALRHSYAPPTGAPPPFSREEIRTMLNTSDDQAAPHPTPAGKMPALQVPPPAGRDAGATRPLQASETPAAPARRWLAGLPALAATLAVIVLTVAIFGIPGLFPGLRNTGNQPLDLRGITLTSISMVSPDEGWAVGNTSPYYTAVDPSSGATNRVQPIILHYAHGRWTPQQLPDFQHSAPCTTLASPGTCTNIALNSISMVSAREGWAVGSTVPPINVTDTTPLGMLLHYTGGKWALVNIQMSYLKSVYMRSASDGWILGNVLGPDGGGPREVLHYDGHAWTPVSDPTFANITPLTLTGTADGQVWISGVDYSVSVGDGFDGNNPAVLLHYDGTRWSKVDAHIANGRISSFAFTGPDEGWAVGFLPNTDQHRASEEDGLILHYHNGVWQEQTRVKDPFGQQYFSFSSVAMVSASDGWAVGNEGVIMHYANGTWTPARSPTGENLSSIVMVSSQEGWAIGAHGTIVHYHNGSWKVFA